jgi:hypothetical protein
MSAVFLLTANIEWAGTTDSAYVAVKDKPSQQMTQSGEITASCIFEINVALSGNTSGVPNREKDAGNVLHAGGI